MNFPVLELLEWFNRNKRMLPWRQTKDMYAIWVSEIMLQQTQVATVIPYYHRFLEQFPTIRDLAGGTEQQVLKLWEGLGYYSRVRNLHRAAQIVVNEHGGTIPAEPESFRKLPGVGPYIAAAVLSISQGIALPTVDGNVLRVYTRFRGIGDDIGKTTVRNRITGELQAVIPLDRPGDFNEALMELGAMVCTPTGPGCEGCPLEGWCEARKKGEVDRYPFKSRKVKVPVYGVSVGIILRGDEFYIQKRPSVGHLGGLWEFPGGKSEEGETPEEALYRECWEELNCGVEVLETLGVVRHAYSHFKIEMTPFICGIGEGELRPPVGVEYRWITMDQLDEYPFPGANHKIFPKLSAYLQKQHLQ